jgi:hypothetical protein
MVSRNWVIRFLAEAQLFSDLAHQAVPKRLIRPPVPRDEVKPPHFGFHWSSQ